MNNTDDLPLVEILPLEPHALSLAAQDAVADFMAAGTAANTVRSYRSALSYWSAWLRLRYGVSLGDMKLPTAAVIQFVVDHLLREKNGTWASELPGPIDAALVAAGVKSKIGHLSYSTVRHRLSALGKWHQVNGWDNPVAVPAVTMLLSNARKAQSRGGITVRKKKTAAVQQPLEAMLAQCTDGVRGIRDRALILLTWSGGRRRSEVTNLQIQDVRQLDEDTWLYALGATKTNTSGERREKPLHGRAAHALSAWLAVVPADTGPLFRRLYRGGKVSPHGLSPDQVARIVQRRAKQADLKGDWAAHSLRSGFVTEAGRQGAPLGDVMEMTEHTSVDTVMGYFQAGSLLNSRVTRLLSDNPPGGQSVGPGDSVQGASLPEV